MGNPKPYYDENGRKYYISEDGKRIYEPRLGLKFVLLISLTIALAITIKVTLLPELRIEFGDKPAATDSPSTIVPSTIPPTNQPLGQLIIHSTIGDYYCPVQDPGVLAGFTYSGHLQVPNGPLVDGTTGDHAATVYSWDGELEVTSPNVPSDGYGEYPFMALNAPENQLGQVTNSRVFVVINGETNECFRTESPTASPSVMRTDIPSTRLTVVASEATGDRPDPTIYSFELLDGQFLVAEGWHIEVVGQQDPHRECMVFLAVGPVEFDLSVIGGAWYLYEGMTDFIQAESIFQDRIQYVESLPQCSSEKMKTIRYP